MKKTASTHVVTASMSSQPLMSCHAGRVNRKKFSGLPKIGSTTPPVARGAYHRSANFGHSVIIEAPVAPATASDTPNAAKRITGSSVSLTGFPLMKIVWPLGKSP
jgi:hypothetical protein